MSTTNKRVDERNSVELAVTKKLVLPTQSNPENKEAQ